MFNVKIKNIYNLFNYSIFNIIKFKYLILNHINFIIIMENIKNYTTSIGISAGSTVYDLKLENNKFVLQRYY